MIDVPRHVPRAIRPAGTWEDRSWRAKLYAITPDGARPRPALLDTARDLAGRYLPQPARTWERYGTAIIAAHESPLYSQVTLAWWEMANELRLRSFRADPQTPGTFDEVTAAGRGLTLWELRLLAFERDAWLRTVLAGTPDLEAYFGETLAETS